MDAIDHWETIYRTKHPHEVSWFQREASVSMTLIRRVRPEPTARIIDVGGGTSMLVDGLVAAGYREVTILDRSTSALTAARTRLGSAASGVTWIDADVRSADLPAGGYDLWHDRALFHFLTSAADRAKYVEQVRRSVAPGGHIIIATFAHDGPTRCSGLPVVRYTSTSLQREFGAGFHLVDSVREEHITPSGTMQAFIYCLFQVESSALSQNVDDLRPPEGGRYA